MQLIFSKKTQIFLVIVKKTTFYIFYNKKPTFQRWADSFGWGTRIRT